MKLIVTANKFFRYFQTHKSTSLCISQRVFTEMSSHRVKYKDCRCRDLSISDYINYHFNQRHEVHHSDGLLSSRISMIVLCW